MKYTVNPPAAIARTVSNKSVRFTGRARNRLTSDPASLHITPFCGDMRQVAGFTEKSRRHSLLTVAGRGLWCK